MKNNKLFWAKVRPDAIIPTKESENAGYDIYANFKEDSLTIMPGETRLIPTGIACAVSEDYYLQVEERGSTGSKGIKKSAGVIDSGYRGEIFIAITNCNKLPIVIANDEKKYCDWINHNIILYPKKKAIAQLIVHKVEVMDEEEISFEELSEIPSKRGAGSLGSSNK